MSVLPLGVHSYTRPGLLQQDEGACPLHRLAKVEMQSVLQWLDSRSRLAAARCSLCLLAAADDPFAWCAADAFVVTISAAGVESRRIASSLLRHAPIALRVEGQGLVSVDEVTSICRLRELHLDAHCAAEDVEPLLSHPALRDLRALRLPGPQTTSHAIALAALLPHLHTLTTSPLVEGADLEPLQRMPALTSLEVHANYTPAQFAVLGQLVGLRSVCLRDLIFFQPDELSSLCSSAMMRSVSHWTVDGMGVFGTGPRLSAAEHRAAFGALDRVQSMRVRRVYGVSDMLVHLHHAPALLTLTLECAPENRSIAYYCGSLLPSAAAVATLLAAAPRLSVHLHLTGTAADWASEGAALQRTRLQRLVADLHPRVTLSDVDDYEPEGDTCEFRAAMHA